MAWEEGEHCKKYNKVTRNDELENVKGIIEGVDAQIWFAKYCRANPYFAVRLLTGIKIAPIQDIILRALFERDFSLIIAGRGFSKSFIISIFIILYALFYPGSKIGICSGTFRQSKNIFKQIEKFVDSEDGIFLKQCVTRKASKSTDNFEIGIGGSSIMATPMGGGDRLRGYRFNVMIVDELLLVPSNIINNVIRPFLSVKQNGQEQDLIRKYENKLIEAGEMDETQRTEFQNNKLIGLSSASFKFEALYKENYETYIKAILDKNAEDVNHCTFRLSYRLAPDWLLDNKLINEAKRTMSSQQFAREFDAIFTDDSGGYFSIEKMEQATKKPGELPMVALKGNANKKYILSIDPNNNDAETSDNFARCLLELDEEAKKGTIVHAYAMPKSGSKKRALYLKYLLENFNIVYIVVDNAGGPQFIRDCNDFGLLPRILDLFDSDFLNADYSKGLRNAKDSYNLQAGKIIHSQVFNEGGWIRLANEKLQGAIERKIISFCSKASSTDEYEKMVKQAIPIENIEFSLMDDSQDNVGKMASFLDHVENLIDQMKKETGLIEITTSSTGSQTFDLTQNLKRDSSPNRARKDLYTTLLLANYAMGCYFSLNQIDKEQEVEGFAPVWVVRR